MFTPAARGSANGPRYALSDLAARLSEAASRDVIAAVPALELYLQLQSEDDGFTTSKVNIILLLMLNHFRVKLIKAQAPS